MLFMFGKGFICALFASDDAGQAPRQCGRQVLIGFELEGDALYGDSEFDEVLLCVKIVVVRDSLQYVSGRLGAEGPYP